MAGADIATDIVLCGAGVGIAEGGGAESAGANSGGDCAADDSVLSGREAVTARPKNKTCILEEL